MTAVEWVAPVVAYGHGQPEPAATAASLAAGLDGTGVKTAPPRVPGAGRP